MQKILENHKLEIKNDEDSKTATIDYQIAHAIKGRLRVRVPLLTQSKELSLCQSRYLETFEGIQKVTSSHLCGSITIHYNPETISQKTILNIIANTRVDELTVIQPRAISTQKEFFSTARSRLGWSTITVALTILFIDTLFPSRILLYMIIILVSIPIYQKAYETIVKEKRIDLDALNAFAMTIGLMADDLVVTSIMAMLIYLGDYANELIASGSNKTLCMLMGDEPEEERQNRKNRKLRTLTGLTTLTAGIILLPLPGPGIVVIPIGLAMLAKEYVWAGKLNTWFKEKLHTA